MRRLARVWPLVVGSLLVASPAAADVVYQEAPPLRLVAFTNEPREPEFGRVFELYLSLRLAPGFVTFLPDTLIPDEHAFSAGPGSWTAAPGPADSVDVQATYPVMGLLNGGVQLPWLEVWSRRAAAGEQPGPRPASELAAAVETERTALERTLVEIGGALILVPSEMAGEEASIDPRPPADVLGGDWSAWLVAALVVTVAAALLLIGMFVAGRRRAAGAGALALGLTPREEALRELDDLLARGWHANGRVDEFYDATTGVLRRLSEVEEPEWRRALTSTELVGRIEKRWGAAPIEKLRPAVWAAERVKFGGHRPAPMAAEADWTAVRDWIRGLPEG
jgi:hypothetical protein